MLSRDVLLDRVWGVTIPAGRARSTSTSRSCGASSAGPALIRTLRGAGTRRSRLKTLRGRLFAAVLAAIVVTVALTVAIGAVLTRRRPTTQTGALARQADNARARAAASRSSYVTSNSLAGGVRDDRRPRATIKTYVAGREPVGNGTLTLERQAVHLLVPAGPAARAAPAAVGERDAAAWRSVPRATSCSRALVGAVLAAALSFVLAGSVVAADPARRRREPRARGGRLPDAAARRRAPLELASLALAFNEMAAQLAESRESRAQLPALGQPRAEDAADRDPRLRRGARRGRLHGRGGLARRSCVETRRLERLVRDLLDLARMNRHEFSVAP